MKQSEVLKAVLVHIIIMVYHIICDYIIIQLVTNYYNMHKITTPLFVKHDIYRV